MDKFKSLRELAALPQSLPEALSDERLSQYWVDSGPMKLWYGTSLVDDGVLAQFQTLTDAWGIGRTFQTLFGDNLLNPTENRAVTHIRLRQVAQRESWRSGITAFADAIHSRQQFDTVIQIGIGGSELGPRAAYHGIKRWAQQHGCHRMKAKFIANLDSDDGRYIAAKINLSRALIIVVSKSGGTLETRANLKLIQSLAEAQGISPTVFKNQLVVVTTKGSPLDLSDDFGYRFYIDDGIGGRLSVTSPVGVLMLTLCFGVSVVTQFLDGAVFADQSACEVDVRDNVALMSAWLGVWDRTILNKPARAVIPYCEGLRFLPAHLQQLECESNGKRVSADGELLSYTTSPVVFGHTGTQAQHSFFQNFHQGTDAIPVEFVGILSGQLDGVVQTDVLANLVGQISALALGRVHDDRRKMCPGNRPSTLLLMASLTPYSLGALMAYYENRTIFQGLIWGINPFDQEGVELGKLLCQQVLSGDSGFPADFYELLVNADFPDESGQHSN